MTIQKPKDIFTIWENESHNFDGDIALYWAGKMATVAKYIVSCSNIHLSNNIILLEMCMQAYDNEIFSRCK